MRDRLSLQMLPVRKSLSDSMGDRLSLYMSPVKVRTVRQEVTRLTETEQGKGAELWISCSGIRKRP